MKIRVENRIEHERNQPAYGRVQREVGSLRIVWKSSPDKQVMQNGAQDAPPFLAESDEMFIAKAGVVPVSDYTFAARPEQAFAAICSGSFPP